MRDRANEIINIIQNILYEMRYYDRGEGSWTLEEFDEAVDLLQKKCGQQIAEINDWIVNRKQAR